MYLTSDNNSTRNKIFRTIYNSGEISKQEIAAQTNLSLPTVTQSLKELFATNLVHSNGFYESTGGRKAMIISVQPFSRVAVGVELLRESIKLCAINLIGNVIKEDFILCPFQNTLNYFRHFGSVVNNFVDSLGIPEERILGIKIAMQGLVSADGEKVIYGKILGNTGTTRASFQRYIRVPCLLIHDTEAAAFAELWQHPEIQNAVYIVLNRNLGGALIINGQIYRGSEYGSCIIEHMRLVPDGKLCYCGQRGCLEEYCSVSSLEEVAGMNIDEFFRRLSDDDFTAIKLFDEYLLHLAQAISNIRTLIDCDFILGGFLEPLLSDSHIEKLTALVKSNFAFTSSSFHFRRGCHGASAASRGAALMQINDFISSI